MRRAAVNVSTGFTYRAYQGRLNQKLLEFGKCGIHLWSDPLPKDWTPHSEVPYRFKSEAMRSVDTDLILWLDSSILPLRSLEPLWQHIEREGYFLPANPGMVNGGWTAIEAYEYLFPDLTVAEAMEQNFKIPHCSSAAFGFNLREEIGMHAYEEFTRLANTRAFCGPWANSNGPDRNRYEVEHLKKLYSTAPCGDASIRGHRHDQSALSVIAWRLGMQLETRWYAHENGTPVPGEEVVLYHKI